MITISLSALLVSTSSCTCDEVTQIIIFALVTNVCRNICASIEWDDTQCVRRSWLLLASSVLQMYRLPQLDTRRVGN